MTVAHAQTNNCGPGVCADNHSCAELNEIVRTRQNVDISFEPGEAFLSGRGTLEFEASAR